MSHLSPVEVVARRAYGVAGISLVGVLTEDAKVVGRIEHRVVWKYIDKLKYSTTKQVLISVLGKITVVKKQPACPP